MDWDAKLYDEKHGFIGIYGSDLVDTVRDIAEKHPRDNGRLRILDIGCGTGAHLSTLAEIGAVVGVDSSPAMVERAREKHPKTDIRVADACALPFESAFDVAFSNAAFHWVADQVALLKSIAGALEQGGWLVAEMGGQDNVARIEKGYAEALRKHSGHYASQFCFPKEAPYRRLLGIAGFEVVSMETFDRPTPLTGGRGGLRRWAQQFYAKSLGLYRPEERLLVLDDLERACEADLWDSTQDAWLADYRRLRFVARKTHSVRAAGGASQLSALGD